MQVGKALAFKGTLTAYQQPDSKKWCSEQILEGTHCGYSVPYPELGPAREEDFTFFDFLYSTEAFLVVVFVDSSIDCLRRLRTSCQPPWFGLVKIARFPVTPMHVLHTFLL
jgi:hypothetical protein